MAKVYRVFELTTGEKLQPVLSSDDSFTIPRAIHQKNIADTYGIAFDSVVVKDVTKLPDLTGALAPPPLPPEPPAALPSKPEDITESWVRDYKKLAAVVSNLAKRVEALEKAKG